MRIFSSFLVVAAIASHAGASRYMQNWMQRGWCGLLRFLALPLQRAITCLQVEHVCHQCGAAVEEGVPFCPECNAPQIRVDAAAASPPLPPGTPGEVQPPAQPVALGQIASGGIDWSKALPAAAIAGVLITLALLIPLAIFFLWMLVGGAFAVALYGRRNSGPITPGAGARIGAVSGLLGYILFALTYSIMLLVSRGGGTLRDDLLRRIQEVASRNPDPQAQQMMQRLMTPEGLAFIIAIGLLLFLFAFLALSSIGGALGAKLFGSRESRRQD